MFVFPKENIKRLRVRDGVQFGALGEWMGGQGEEAGGQGRI